MSNLKPTTMKRIKQDYLRLKKDPIPYITAEPLPYNILEWHYVIKGPEKTPYQGGYYHGIIKFPPEFPFKPPSILMLTPNGRFKPNTNLCLSITDFHPHTWNPTWSVGTILNALLSFMLETSPTLGSMESLTYEKQQYAAKSLEFNLKNSKFRELFPTICEEINLTLNEKQNSTDDEVTVTPSTTDTDACEIDSDSSNHDSGGNDRPVVENKWKSFYSNFVELFIFGIFGLIVHCVIQNLT